MDKWSGDKATEKTDLKVNSSCEVSRNKPLLLQLVRLERLVKIDVGTEKFEGFNKLKLGMFFH